MRRENCLYLVLATAILLTLAGLAYAHEGFCAHCGHGGSCQKVCRLVCEDKKVEIICWGCLCEDFCVACPGKRGCEHCKMVCGECDCDPETPVAKPKKFLWTDWLPTRATMYTRTKLMKKTITKSVPTYKWVVEDLCPHCEANCPCASVTPDTQLPPIPVADARVKFGKLAAENHSTMK